MAVDFYCKVNGAIIGPISNNQLMAMASNGKLSPEDFIRTNNSTAWIKANKISGLVFNTSKTDQTEIKSTKKEPSKFQATNNISNSKSQYSSISILSFIYLVFGYVILFSIPPLLIIGVIKSWGDIGMKEAFVVLGLVIFGAISGVSMVAFGQLLQLAINTADNIQLLTQSFVKSLKQPINEN